MSSVACCSRERRDPICCDLVHSLIPSTPCHLPCQFISSIPLPLPILPNTPPSFHTLSNPVHRCLGDVAKYTHSPTEEDPTHLAFSHLSGHFVGESQSSPSPPPPPPSPLWPPVQDPPLPMRLSLAGLARPAILA